MLNDSTTCKLKPFRLFVVAVMFVILFTSCDGESRHTEKEFTSRENFN